MKTEHPERILRWRLGWQREFDDKEMGSSHQDVTFDGGGRYKFHKGVLLLFMAGRSFKGNSSGQPEFLGYGGIRVLLNHYGTRLHSDN